MKYRLLKPLNNWPAGTMAEYEGEESTRSFGPSLRLLCMERGSCKDEYVPHQLASDPDWFEEVKPFQPEVHERFFFITPAFDVDSAKVQPNDMYDLILNAGNCFRTEAEAESCAVELRKTLAAWKEAHE